MRRRFDWPGLMQAGLRGLGLTPDQFWRLTPLELRITTLSSAEPLTVMPDQVEVPSRLLFALASART